jgi:hypothetical protein
MSPVRAETRTTRLRSSSVSIVYARTCKDNQIQIDRQVSGPIEMKMLHQSHCSRVVTLCHISRWFSSEMKYIHFGRSRPKKNSKTTGTLLLPAGWLEVATCGKNSHFKLRRTGRSADRTPYEPYVQYRHTGAVYRPGGHLKA